MMMMMMMILMYRLYKSVGEYDVVNAILRKHVTTHPVTLRAIDDDDIDVQAVQVGGRV